MLRLIRKVYYTMLEYKKKKYLEYLVKKGFKIGKNVVIMDGFFLDPTHCFLISIGDNCVLAPNVRLIAHDASMKQHLGYTRVGKVRIEANCFIGDSIIILPGVTIGKGAIVGAGSVVTKDIPPESVATGNPCRVVCSRKDFLQKHEQVIVSRKAPFAELKQDQLTTSQKAETSKFLDSGTGYVR